MEVNQTQRSNIFGISIPLTIILLSLAFTVSLMLGLVLPLPIVRFYGSLGLCIVSIASTFYLFKGKWYRHFTEKLIFICLFAWGVYFGVHGIYALIFNFYFHGLELEGKSYHIIGYMGLYPEGDTRLYLYECQSGFFLCRIINDDNYCSHTCEPKLVYDDTERILRLEQSGYTDYEHHIP